MEFLPDNLLEMLSTAGLYTAFATGLGWAFLGYYVRREQMAAIAGAISCFAALVSSLCANELANRSNATVLLAISARTLHDSDVDILDKAMPAGPLVVNVQYEGDDPLKRDLHDDEEYSFKFSLENGFRSTKAAKEGRLKIEPYAIPTLGFKYGTDITLYVPNHRYSLMDTLNDPFYKAFTKMGFSVLPTNHAFKYFPDRIVETETDDGSAYPTYYIVSVNHKPPARLRGRPYWGLKPASRIVRNGRASNTRNVE